MLLVLVFAVVQARYFLSIGILSAARNFEKRQLLRETWLQEVKSNPELRAIFIVGRDANEWINEACQAEQTAKGDLLLTEVSEDYYQIAAKTRRAIQWAFPGSDHLLKCDDDTVVHVRQLLEDLTELRDPHLYMGTFYWHAAAIREPWSKFYLSLKQWKRATLPNFAAGCGYVLGSALGEYLIAQNFLNQTLPMEDVTVGWWVEQAQKNGPLVNLLHSTRIKATRGCEPGDYILHRYSPSMMRCLWEQRNSDDPCCTEHKEDL